MGGFDFKKEYKDLYLPKAKPAVVRVPDMLFIMADGQGDPNTCAQYKNAMEALYALSYCIKMSKMNGTQPRGYFEYVVPPLEGLWSLPEGCFGEGGYNGGRVADKSAFTWTAMIRQPDFVTEEAFALAVEQARKKRPEADLSVARLQRYEEGLCAQVMHNGPYDDEPATVEALSRFIAESGYRTDISPARPHHEIYLGDPRRTAPEKLRTVLRHPIAPA